MNRPDIHLHMVDSWAEGSEEYKDSGDYHACLTKSEQDGFYQDSLRNTNPFADRRTVWRMDSVEAAKNFADNSLDFVFIDADHSYEGCKRDIDAWKPKLKENGLLCGHDYDNKDYPHWGVKRAVDELGDIELGDDYTWFFYEPLVVCCVKWGKKYPAEYVNILKCMVQKNLRRPFRFVCFTEDDSGLDKDIEARPLFTTLEGWWNKLYLFKKGLFGDERILYLDLDVCITGSLDELARQHGIIFDWNLPTYNSSVMVWKSGQHTDIWDKFTPEVADRLHGDQDWISELAGWPLLPANMCVSYRKHAVDCPPVYASVVCFHGNPKPHDYPSEWVKRIWDRNGLSGIEFIDTLNNNASNILEQARQNVLKNIPWQQECEAHERVACIVGGGPSLSDTYQDIHGDVFSLNGTHDWLLGKGIIPKYHVLLDSRQENGKFVTNPHSEITYLISGYCHEDVFNALETSDKRLWLSEMSGIYEVLQEAKITPPMLICGGGTVGLKAMFLAYLMGYRSFELFGFDSSYQENKNHAYPQPLNDGESVITVNAAGKDFVCANWMAKQCIDFQKQARILHSLGCRITVHGEGLIPWVMQHLNLTT